MRQDAESGDGVSLLGRGYGIDNLRDIGGVPLADGRHVRAGYLYRSAHLAHLTEQGRAWLRAHDVTLRIDLRRPQERALHPAPAWREPAPCLVVNGGNAHTAGSETPMAFIGGSDGDVATVRAQMHAAYRRFPFDEGLSRAYAHGFAGLADTTGAALVHCHAGKDRTGLFVALLLSLLGASRDAIVAEYMLSNDAELDIRVARTMASLARRGLSAREDVVRFALSVQADFLALSIATIEARCGSVASYLADHLHVDKARAAAITARLATN